jgi:hypothetical protein
MLLVVNEVFVEQEWLKTNCFESMGRVEWAPFGKTWRFFGE